MKQTLILLVILALTYSSCKNEIDDSPPVATFTADKTIVTEGETVRFTDQTINTPISWSWDFGDGNTSSSQNPSHAYSPAGSYTVSLTVTNCYGSDTETKTDYITVESGTVTDYDGNTYKTVIIGTQEWMAENLKVTHYPNGDIIPHVTDNTAWKNLADNNTDDAYCFYNNNSGTDYGALYTYAAAIGDNWERDNADGQGVCPDGWHLPTVAEWTILIDYLGGENVAGGKMKETGTMHWHFPNEGATNESGFTALPGGFRLSHIGSFASEGTDGWFWSVAELNATSVFCMLLGNDYGSIGSYSVYKSNGYSVRCLRD